MIDTINYDNQQAIANLDPKAIAQLWEAANQANDYALETDGGAALNRIQTGLRSGIQSILDAMATTDAGAPCFTTSAWLVQQFNPLCPLSPGSAVERLEAIARIHLWASSLELRWPHAQQGSHRGCSVLYGRADLPAPFHGVESDVPLNSDIAQLLNRLRAACLPSGDEDFDPRAALDLTRITYPRLLADLQAADASVWINRRSVAALVPQLWGAIADVMPGSRAQGRLSSVLRLALALYAMASASVFIEGDDLVLDER